MLERAVGAAARIKLEGRLGEKVGLIDPGAESHTSGFNCTREEAIRRKDLSELRGTQWSEEGAAGCRVSAAGARFPCGVASEDLEQGHPNDAGQTKFENLVKAQGQDKAGSKFQILQLQFAKRSSLTCRTNIELVQA